MATIINSIPPESLEIQTYSSQDISILTPESISSTFDLSRGDYIEYTITSPNQTFQIGSQILNDVSINSVNSNDGATFVIDLDPERDLRNNGFSNGEYYILYNFLRNELDSSPTNRIFWFIDLVYY
jgi:hypothetical protein